MRKKDKINILILLIGIVIILVTENNIIYNNYFYILLGIGAVILFVFFSLLYKVNWTENTSINHLKVIGLVATMTFFVISPILQIFSKSSINPSERYVVKGTIVGVSQPSLRNHGYGISYQPEGSGIKQWSVSLASKWEYGEEVKDNLAWKNPEKYRNINAVGFGSPLGIVLIKLDI